MGKKLLIFFIGVLLSSSLDVGTLFGVGLMGFFIGLLVSLMVAG